MLTVFHRVTKTRPAQTRLLMRKRISSLLGITKLQSTKGHYLLTQVKLRLWTYSLAGSFAHMLVLLGLRLRVVSCSWKNSKSSQYVWTSTKYKSFSIFSISHSLINFSLPKVNKRNIMCLPSLRSRTCMHQNKSTNKLWLLSWFLVFGPGMGDRCVGLLLISTIHYIFHTPGIVWRAYHGLSDSSEDTIFRQALCYKKKDRH